jgi:methionyl aminopeptidase
MKRNELCWCGSGKKYKRCHMNQDIEKQSKNGTIKNGMIKTPEEMAAMRIAGAFNGRLMDYIRPFVKAGITTAEIDRLVHEYTVNNGAVPATLGYHGFPKSVCTSINDVVCHGIPSASEILKDGDIVNVDITSIVNGFLGDSSETFMIGDVSQQAKSLVETAARALLAGISSAGPGKQLEDIAVAIEAYVKLRGCSVVRQYTGHGIGRKFHENFTVFHHVSNDCDDITLRPGMTFTIEPMINLGGWKVVTSPVDGWTVRTSDGKLSAQFEHTVLVTETGMEILTLTPSQISAGRPLLINGLEI